MHAGRHLTRLPHVGLPHAIYFITTCTVGRKPILTSDAAVSAPVEEWRAASERHGGWIGHYVVMLDHVHFFCAEQPGGALRNLSGFVNAWKTWTAHRIMDPAAKPRSLWQRGFFDHVLRREESCAEKWS